jgi:hypothetical protein
MNISQMIATERNNPDLFSQIDINKLLQSLEDEKHTYLENKTLKSISTEIFHKLQEIYGNNDEITRPLCDKLKEYFLVTHPCELRKSHYIRYVKNGDLTLCVGGVLVDIKYENNNIYVCLLAFGKRCIKLKYTNNVFFQKLSGDEKIILLSMDYLDRFNPRLGVPTVPL